MTSESGLQLFARLAPRPSLVGLEDTLMPQGPGPREVVEVGGDPACGKTLLLTQWVAKCVTPKEWKGATLAGLGIGVVLLNTDHHFQVYKLISLMEARLSAACDSFTVHDIEDIVKDSLGRFTIYNIVDSHQLTVTLFALQQLISTRTDISLVLLDSICAFYWQDAMATAPVKMDTYAKNVLKTVQKSLGDFKGVIVYTRPSYFHTKSSGRQECSVEAGPGCITRRIFLKQHLASDSTFCACVTSPTGIFDKIYKIDSSGVIWI